MEFQVFQTLISEEASGLDTDPALPSPGLSGMRGRGSAKPPSRRGELGSGGPRQAGGPRRPAPRAHRPGRPRASPLPAIRQGAVTQERGSRRALPPAEAPAAPGPRPLPSAHPPPPAQPRQPPGLDWGSLSHCGLRGGHGVCPQSGSGSPVCTLGVSERECWGEEAAAHAPQPATQGLLPPRWRGVPAEGWGPVAGKRGASEHLRRPVGPAPRAGLPEGAPSGSHTEAGPSQKVPENMKRGGGGRRLKQENPSRVSGKPQKGGGLLEGPEAFRPTGLPAAAPAGRRLPARAAAAGLLGGFPRRPGPRRPHTCTTPFRSADDSGEEWRRRGLAT